MWKIHYPSPSLSNFSKNFFVPLVSVVDFYRQVGHAVAYRMVQVPYL
jgi:hypothetical protein